MDGLLVLLFIAGVFGTIAAWHFNALRTRNQRFTGLSTQNPDNPAIALAKIGFVGTPWDFQNRGNVRHWLWLEAGPQGLRLVNSSLFPGAGPAVAFTPWDAWEACESLQNPEGDIAFTAEAWDFHFYIDRQSFAMLERCRERPIPIHRHLTG